MSTRLHTTQTDETRTGGLTSPSSRPTPSRDAPLTFDPQNTDPCPEMFDDRWQAEDR